jgi:hypothetical protein
MSEQALRQCLPKSFAKQPATYPQPPFVVLQQNLAECRCQLVDVLVDVLLSCVLSRPARKLDLNDPGRG